MHYYVGLDLGDTQHSVAVMNQNYALVHESTVKNDQVGMKALVAVLQSWPDVHLIAEQPNGLFVENLVAQGYDVWHIPPKVAHQRQVGESKDDRRDARLLAQLLCRRDIYSRPVALSSPETQAVAQLVHAYEHLQSEQLAMTGQLRAILKRYYPIATRLFSRLNQPLTLAFLVVYPTPEAAQAASLEDLTTFFKEQSYRYMDRVPTLYAHLQSPQLKAAVTSGYETMVQAWIACLHEMNQSLKQIKKQLIAACQAHPEYAWWRALPGVGLLTAARLITYIGDNRDRFPTPESLQMLAGTAPVTRQSGKKKVVSFRLGCDRALRRTATDLARLSVTKSTWARDYFEQQRTAGHDVPRAYRALANRWLKIIWTIWQRREAYDEAKHIANRERHLITPSLPSVLQISA
jgi:transposase